MAEMSSVLSKTHAWACYDCGKCTATCPVARAGSPYSPRRQVLSARLNGAGDPATCTSLFTCLTCGLCDLRCPANVSYTDLVLSMREAARGAGAEPECPHGGALQSLMRMMAGGGTMQDRLGWLTPDLSTVPEKGDVFLWTGCTMYYDAFFPEFSLGTLKGTRAAVKVLNALGIRPVVSANERCCGHDLLWNGDRANFERLARHNTKLVSDSGARTILIPCAECYRTWTVDYAPFISGKGPRVLHFTEFLAESVRDLKLEGNSHRKVTYQDPCRMGRHLGVYDPPRQVLAAIPGVELVEMGRAGPKAACCAGGTWSNCDRYAKKTQVERLREARATGAEVLLTACPKCRIHFRCAMHDPKQGPEIEIEMLDVAELAAAALA